MRVFTHSCLILGFLFLSCLAEAQNIRGTPGVDYPNYFSIPKSSFKCSDQKYIPGFYADLETRCQVFHFCFDKRKESFLCPVGTTFNQRMLTCDYWYRTNCTLAPAAYDVNTGPAIEKMAKNIPWLLKMRNRPQVVTTTSEAPTPATILEKLNDLFQEKANDMKEDLKSHLEDLTSDNKETGTETDAVDYPKLDSSETENLENRFPAGEELDGYQQDGTEYDPETGTLLVPETESDWKRNEDDFENFYASKDSQGFGDGGNVFEGLNSALKGEFDMVSEKPFEDVADDATDPEYEESDFSRRSVVPKRRRRKPVYLVLDDETEEQFGQRESAAIDSVPGLVTESAVDFQDSSDFTEETLVFDGIEPEEVSRNLNSVETAEESDEEVADENYYRNFLETSSVVPHVSYLETDGDQQGFYQISGDADLEGGDPRILYDSNEVQEENTEPSALEEEASLSEQEAESNLYESKLSEVGDDIMQGDDERVYVYSDGSSDVREGVSDYSEGDSAGYYNSNQEQTMPQWSYQEVPETEYNSDIQSDYVPYTSNEGQNVPQWSYEEISETAFDPVVQSDYVPYTSNEEKAMQQWSYEEIPETESNSDAQSDYVPYASNEGQAVPQWSYEEVPETTSNPDVQPDYVPYYTSNEGQTVPQWSYGKVSKTDLNSDVPSDYVPYYTNNEGSNVPEWSYAEVASNSDARSDYVSPYFKTAQSPYFSYVQQNEHSPDFRSPYAQLRSPYIDVDGSQQSQIPGYGYPQYYPENYAYSQMPGQEPLEPSRYYYPAAPGTVGAGYGYAPDQVQFPAAQEQYADSELDSTSEQSSFEESAGESQGFDGAPEETFYEIEDEMDSRSFPETYQGQVGSESVVNPEEYVEGSEEVGYDDGTSEEEVFYELDDEPEDAEREKLVDNPDGSSPEEAMEESNPVSEDEDLELVNLESDVETKAEGGTSHLEVPESNPEAKRSDSLLLQKLLSAQFAKDPSTEASGSEISNEKVNLQEKIDEVQPTENQELIVPVDATPKPLSQRNLAGRFQKPKNGFVAPTENEFLGNAMFQSPVGFNQFGFNMGQQFSSVDSNSKPMGMGQSSFPHVVGNSPGNSKLSTLSSLQRRMRSLKGGKFGIFKNYLNAET